MSVSNEHDGWRDAVATYALGALTETERGRLEEHLETCALCRADIRWLQPAAEAIGAAVEPRRPPGRLRRRVVGTARAEARPRRVSGGLERMIRWPALAAAAATTVLIAGLTVGYALRGNDGPMGSTVQAEATPAAPGLEAALVREGDSARLEITGLDAPGPAHVYQAWIRIGEEIAPSTVFVPDRRGRAAAAITGELNEADEVMVTREPRGGSIRPSTAPLLRASLG
jgi:anti-sigma-K factor RskA